MKEHYLKLLPGIKTFMFDVDGVLTDGSVTLMPNGEQVRKMSSRDGYALQLAVKKGYRVVIITGGSSQQVKDRLQGLGIQDVFLKSSDKKEVFDEYLMIHDLDPMEILYMGDDIPDYEVMQEVGVAACPSDAATEIREISAYISPVKGGYGCVRDVIEKVLRSQKNWFQGKEDLKW